MFDTHEIKAITLDFDGTTLQRDKIWLSPRNYRALKECQKRGIVCIPCTGRSADMFPPQFEDTSFRYWFTCCGARVIDRLTGGIIYKDGLTPEQSAEICRIFEGLGIYCEVAAEGRLLFEKDVMDNLYKYPVPPHHVWYMYASGRPVTVYGKLSDYFLSQNIGAEKFNLYGIPEDKYREMLDRFNALPYVLTKMSDPVGIQVQSRNVDCIKAMQTLPGIQFCHDVPDWNSDGTVLNEEMVLITQSRKELQTIMSSYVGIVRSNLRLQRAFDRLEILYRETEELYKKSILFPEICELRNMINVGYLIIRNAMDRKESRGLHYSLDYPPYHSQNK